MDEESCGKTSYQDIKNVNNN